MLGQDMEMTDIPLLELFLPNIGFDHKLRLVFRAVLTRKLRGNWT